MQLLIKNVDVKSVLTKSDLVLRDLERIKTFPNARVAWSINTIDESFREDMDMEVSIERRLNSVVFMDQGMILEEGLPDDISENSKHERTRRFLSRYQSGIRV